MLRRGEEADPGEGHAGGVGALQRQARTTWWRAAASARGSSRRSSQVLDDIHLQHAAARHGVAGRAARRRGRELRHQERLPGRRERRPAGRSGTCSSCPPHDSEIVTGNEISSAQADHRPERPADRLAAPTRTAAARTSTNITRSHRASRAWRRHAAGRCRTRSSSTTSSSPTPTVDPQRVPERDRRRLDQRRQRDHRPDARRTPTGSRSRSSPARCPSSSRRYSQQLVSATLGKDSLRNGLIAGVAGLVFVMIFLLRLLRLPRA